MWAESGKGGVAYLTAKSTPTREAKEAVPKPEHNGNCKKKTINNSEENAY